MKEGNTHIKGSRSQPIVKPVEGSGDSQGCTLERRRVLKKDRKGEKKRTEQLGREPIRNIGNWTAKSPNTPYRRGWFTTNGIKEKKVAGKVWPKRRKNLLYSFISTGQTELPFLRPYWKHLIQCWNRIMGMSNYIRVSYHSNLHSKFTWGTKKYATGNFWFAMVLVVNTACTFSLTDSGL